MSDVLGYVMNILRGTPKMVEKIVVKVKNKATGVYEVVDVIKIEIKKAKEIPMRIDNYVFLLHYKASLRIMVTFAVIITTKQFFGDPIDCIVDSSVSKYLKLEKLYNFRCIR